MSESIVVELRLIEQTFRLNTTEDKREELERAAELLNQKFQEMRRAAPRENIAFVRWKFAPYLD